MAQPLSSSAKRVAADYQDITRFCQHLEFFANHPPLQVTPLLSGEHNVNFYVRTERGEYVLRRYPTTTLGVCRQQELRCQHAAAAAGLAPAPLCLNNHQQLLISEYVTNGEPLTLTAARLPLLAQCLGALHSLKVQTPVLTVGTYLRQLMHNAHLGTLEPARSLFQALQETAVLFEKLPADVVLCHMDLHAANLLWSAERIWMLDFEYAQLADSSFDLAALVLHFHLTGEQQQQLLRHYHQRRQFPDSQCAQGFWQSIPSRLALAKVLYSGFCWLWYLAMPAASGAADTWQQILRTQLAALGAHANNEIQWCTAPL